MREDENKCVHIVGCDNIYLDLKILLNVLNIQSINNRKKLFKFHLCISKSDSWSFDSSSLFSSIN